MPAALRLGLAVAYLAAGAFCLRRVAGAGGAGERLGYGAHALMALSMATTALFKPWWPDWQMVVFAVAGGWYAVRATGASLTSAVATHSGHLRIRWAHHAVVMAAMVWMLFAMVSAPPASVMAGMAAPGAAEPSALATVSGVYCLVATVLLLSASGVAALRRRGAAEDAVSAVMTAGAGLMLLAL